MKLLVGKYVHTYLHRWEEVVRRILQPGGSYAVFLLGDLDARPMNRWLRISRSE